MIQLRNYQQEGNDNIAKAYSRGVRSLIRQLPTGGGKTIEFCALIDRFTKVMNNSVVVAVHRDELLKQTRKSLYNHFGIHSEAIISGRKRIPYSKVYVAMVDTLSGYIKKNPRFASTCGMIIVDECHIGNFKKLEEHFTHALRVGYSATPIASSKKDPLLQHYEEIIVGPQIEELIHMGSLCPNETYSIKGINRKNFGISKGDFNNTQMGSEFSNTRHVHNTVEAYNRLCEGKKTIVFNCNVAHSLLVNQAFLDQGFNSRHLDGSESDTFRRETLEWFHNTPDAILNNIGVLTTGFDEPSVINVIINRSTMSLPLLLQMCGRGSRPYAGKDFFRIIDMGGNILVHGDWGANRDWNYIFQNPDKPSDGGGVAPIKMCDKCEAIIPAQSIICKFCGHEHERILNYDTFMPEFELVVGRIQVESLIKDQKERGQKDFKVFFDILNKSVTILKYKLNGMPLSDEVEQKAFILFEQKIKEWRKHINLPYDRYTQGFAQLKFKEECNKIKNIVTI